jgi:hypothetical protein
MIDDNDLDAMLSAPLAEVAEDGFPGRVARAIDHAEAWRERITWSIPLLAAAVAAPFLPLAEISETALRLGPAIGGSAAMAAALAAVVLTVSFEQRYRDWQSGAL